VVPSDFAGIFSRYFVIGFFLPVFFALVLVAHVIYLSSTPYDYSSASGATQIVILGGAGLLGGLLLLGVNQYVVRIFAGYPLKGLITSLARRLDPKGRPVEYVLWPISRNLAKKLLLEEEAEREGASDPEKTEAALKVNKYFPSQAHEIMPTKLGNAIRAFQSYPFKTYGLDGPPNWSRVEALVTENEKEALAETLTTFAFWLNLILLTVAATIYIWVADVLGRPHSTRSTEILTLVSFAAGTLVAWGAYCAAVGAAINWGASVRAAYDLHRLELYERLGLKRPRTEEEEEEIAKAANRAASFGEKLTAGVRNTS
jgi:hypothetical protein